MIALDTNVLVRFLVRDDKPQAEHARLLIETRRSKGDECLITHPVLCELERFSIASIGPPVRKSARRSVLFWSHRPS